MRFTEIKPSGDGKWMKLKGGANPVRLLTDAHRHEKVFSPGEKATIRYACYVIDLSDPARPVRLLDMPQVVARQIGQWEEVSGLEARDPNAPPFSIVAEGDGKARKYNVISGMKPFPIPPTIDVASLQRELDAMTFDEPKKSLGTEFDA